MTDVRKEVLCRMAKECATSIDGLVIAGLPRGFDMAKISRMRTAGARFETWLYDGTPFLELHDPEPNGSWDGGDVARIGFEMKYRYLNTKTESAGIYRSPHTLGNIR
jgi:hypothetical protein